MLLSACKRPVAVGVQGTRRYVHWADVAVRRFQAKHSVKANKVGVGVDPLHARTPVPVVRI